MLAGPSEAGDEPFLMAQRCPRALVAVGADRVALGRWVLEQYPVDYIVLDDGFQHRALHRDVDLVLLDATDAAGLDALLPSGRLREPLEALERASAMVITRADSRQDVEAVQQRLRKIAQPSEDIIEVVFRPESFLAIGSAEPQALEWGQGKRAWLVSGIGNSPSFRRSVESIGVEIVGETVFEDHHRYCDEEIRQIRATVQTNGSEIVLTTEKDGGKLSHFLRPNDPWWMLRLGTEVVRGKDQLQRLIEGPSSDGIQRLGARA
jgi:tetraacyldisaccharide 4'-kinase